VKGGRGGSTTNRQQTHQELLPAYCPLAIRSNLSTNSPTLWIVSRFHQAGATVFVGMRFGIVTTNKMSSAKFPPSMTE
jgi:hypothetical protein